MKPTKKATFEILLLPLSILFVVSLWWRASLQVDSPSARESILRVRLSSMRAAIDNYTTDKKHPPESLQTLVEDGDISEIPPDPITSRKDWVLSVIKVRESMSGIDDVHSSSSQRSTEGTPYNTW
jgi:general secretion pathway protein G